MKWLTLKMEMAELVGSPMLEIGSMSWPAKVISFIHKTRATPISARRGRAPFLDELVVILQVLTRFRHPKIHFAYRRASQDTRCFLTRNTSLTTRMCDKLRYDSITFLDPDHLGCECYPQNYVSGWCVWVHHSPEPDRASGLRSLFSKFLQ